MEFPLSKRERQLLKEIKEAFHQHNNSIMIDNEAEFIESKEIMDLLVEKGFVYQTERRYVAKNYAITHKPTYVLLTDFERVMSWIEDQDTKAKRPSQREWKIAIFSSMFSAITGLIIGILTSDMILKFVANLWK